MAEFNLFIALRPATPPTLLNFWEKISPIHPAESMRGAREIHEVTKVEIWSMSNDF